MLFLYKCRIFLHALACNTYFKYVPFKPVCLKLKKLIQLHSASLSFTYFSFTISNIQTCLQIVAKPYPIFKVFVFALSKQNENSFNRYCRILLSTSCSEKNKALNSLRTFFIVLSFSQFLRFEIYINC